MLIIKCKGRQKNGFSETPKKCAVSSRSSRGILSFGGGFRFTSARRFFSAALASVLLLCSCAQTPTNAWDGRYTGDADRSTAINAADALLVLQYSVNKIGISALDTEMCDVNCDKTVNAADALGILLYAVGKIDSFGEITDYIFPGCGALPVHAQEIPDLFLMYSGRTASTKEDWESQRCYLKALLSNYLYGYMPDDTANLSVSSFTSLPLPDCNAIMQEMTLSWGRGLTEKIRITYPDTDGCYPVIMKLDYLCDWVYRGSIEEQMLSEGRYAFVTISRKDLAPDDAQSLNVPMLSSYKDYDMGAVAMWAYGAIAAIDYISTQSFADMSKICLTGHSRDGKAAICAAAMDERISVVVPNGSGCAGAGSFFKTGRSCEKAEDLANNFPHWFTSDFYSFKGNWNRYPVDMIYAFALIAPRAVLRTEAENDLWANPDGNKATLKAAKSVYEYLGADTSKNALYIRPGDHNQTAADWEALKEFCDMCFYGKQPSLSFITQ